MYVRFCLQVDLEGETGHVAFDDNGHRRDFQLSVNEVNLNTDARPVHSLITMIVITRKHSQSSRHVGRW